MERCEDIRHTIGVKELYDQRKETIERIFGTAKENHGFRYTQMKGKARMELKVGLTFTCMNLKKLAEMLHKRALKKHCFCDFGRKNEKKHVCPRIFILKQTCFFVIRFKCPSSVNPLIEPNLQTILI